ncbi:two-component sensor histidine kinase [Streptomyces sp. TRM66268-LWL]|uniref:histidine kinase n=1 Tax=Streptomyces polyasparticus TaxID=2767826 RepID=A0ABR7SGD5_9ACTN|nr:histidine kinase [Streptomyces polyasparticus]MBC9714547.1 two-component sensor histidine kinase [Streptomyces polyasparticus]
MIRGGLGALRADLFSGAFAFRPLPPLPADHRFLKRIPARFRDRGRWLPHASVVLAAVLVFLLGLADGGSSGDDFVGLLQGFAGALPVLLTLTRPIAAFWLSMAISVFGVAIGGVTYDGAFPWTAAGFLGHLVVMTQVALRSRPRVAAEMWLITAAFGAMVVGYEGNGDDALVAMVILSAFALAAAVSLGGWNSARQEVAVKEAEVAAKEEDTLAERSKRTRLEERTNIARELHDVVAHHMSVVAIQAEAAPYRVENPPPELEQAFATIRENAVAALTELRRVLGVVRAEDYEAPDAPQPTLADLEGLLANVREAGLRVGRTITGSVRELPPGVELSAYRIVQEALSNTLRHAPGASAKVEVSYVLGGLGIRVVNGPATGLIKASPGAGHGITGMRERVAMLSGAMTAGETADGGYEVSVFLPVEQASPESATGEGA